MCDIRNVFCSLFSSCGIMASPPEKRLRIQRLRDRLPYLSQSALCEVLKVAETEGLPPAASRRTIGRCRDDVAQLQTPYGPLHRTLSVPSRAGAAVELEVQNPFAMLYHTAAVSPYVAGLILQAAQREPPSAASPWKLFLYGDEITPGNQMSYKGERKFWGFYWTIGQFGSAALSDEDNVMVELLHSKSFIYIRCCSIGFKRCCSIGFKRCCSIGLKQHPSDLNRYIRRTCGLKLCSRGRNV